MYVLDFVFWGLVVRRRNGVAVKRKNLEAVCQNGEDEGKKRTTLFYWCIFF